MKPSDGAQGGSHPLEGLKSVAELGYNPAGGAAPAPKTGRVGMDAYLETLGGDPEPDPEPEPEPKRAAKAAAKPGKDPESPGTGKDLESAGEAQETAAGEEPEEVDDDSVLQTILEKFSEQPESPARRLRKAMNGQSEDPELKAALERMETLEEVAGRLLVEGEDGWDVRPEHAGRALAAQRGNGAPNEAQIRAAIVARYKETLLKSGKVDEDSIDEFVDAQKPIIDEQVAGAVAFMKQQARYRETQEHLRVIKVLQDHLTKHPKDDTLVKSLDELLARMPDELKGRVVTEGWLGGSVGRLFALLRKERDMGAALTEAYEAGKKAGKAPKVSVTGERGTAGGSPRRGKTTGFDEQSFRQGLREPRVHIAGASFPKFDTLVGRK